MICNDYLSFVGQMAGDRRKARTVGLPAPPPHVPLRRRQHHLLGLVDEERHRVEIGLSEAGSQETAARQMSGTSRAEIRPRDPSCRSRTHQHQQQAFRKVPFAQEAEDVPAQIGERDDHLKHFFGGRVTTAS